MTKQKPPVSVSKMAELCQLSRQRFYDYLTKNVFPRPIYDGHRPMYTAELQEVVLKIRQTGIALDGRQILFNKPRKQIDKRSARPKQNSSLKQFEPMMESMKMLGLEAVNAKQVAAALRTLYPHSIPDLESGDVIKAVFLHLKLG